MTTYENLISIVSLPDTDLTPAIEAAHGALAARDVEVVKFREYQDFERPISLSAQRPEVAMRDAVRQLLSTLNEQVRPALAQEKGVILVQGAPTVVAKYGAAKGLGEETAHDALATQGCLDVTPRRTIVFDTFASNEPGNISETRKFFPKLHSPDIHERWTMRVSLLRQAFAKNAIRMMAIDSHSDTLQKDMRAFLS